MDAPRECPCFSGLRYAACCAPFHKAEREAPSPEALMRSRYAAFALGLGAYLVKTLAKAHEDRALPAEDLARALGQTKHAQKFMGLSILHAASRESDGEVLFYARIFEKGAERSFVELSQFVKEGDAWRYVSGEPIIARDISGDPRLVDKAKYLEILASKSV